MVVFIFILLSTIWGSTWLVIKIGLEDMSPFWFATGRFIMAVIPLLIIAWLRRCSLPKSRDDWRLIASSGVLIFGSNYALVFWAEVYISSGLAAILYTSLPIFGMVITHFYRRMEAFSLKKLGGILTGVLGVAFIFRDQLNLSDAMAIWGCVAVLVASAGTAFGSVLVKAHGRYMDILTLTTGQMLVGLVPLSTLALCFEPVPAIGALSTRAWMSMIYLGVFGSALTFVLNNWLIKQIPVTTTQLIPFASTVLAVWLGVAILGEPLHLTTIIGAVLVLTGLLLATRSNASYRAGLLRQDAVNNAGGCPDPIHGPGENHAVEAEV